MVQGEVLGKYPIRTFYNGFGLSFYTYNISTTYINRVTHLKSYAMALDFWLQTDIFEFFQMIY